MISEDTTSAASESHPIIAAARIYAPDLSLRPSYSITSSAIASMPGGMVRPSVQLILLTTRHAIPTIFAWREFALAGGLMSYGMSLATDVRQVGINLWNNLVRKCPRSYSLLARHGSCG